jgi:formate C-acetyltransferase
MQFFGARANLAKCLNYAINGGKDAKFTDKQGNHMQVGPELAPITSEYLDYDEVMHKFDLMMDWLAGLYVNILNLIQYMHDKYYYEAAEMALIDTDVRRTFATGIAGFSHVVDSLSAIKYAKVKTVRDETGLVVDYKVEGDFPRYGNDDDRADDIAVWLLKTFITKVKKHHTYRNSEPTTSILTITSTWSTARNRRPARRPSRLHAVLAGCQPLLRRREERPSGFPQLRGKAPVRVRPGRHLQHADHQPVCTGHHDEQRTLATW